MEFNYQFFKIINQS